MESSDRDLKCVYCRAILESLIQNEAYLRDQGFKHDHRYCERCKPGAGSSTSIEQPDDSKNGV